MTEVVFMAPLSALRKRTRLAKMVPVLLARGLHVHFFGWEREPAEHLAFDYGDPRVVERVILRGGGYASSRARMYYPIWMIVVFWHVMRLGRGQTIFALGWETAFPACLAATFTGARIVFDDADRFSMILRLPGPLQRLLQRLEQWTSRHTHLHLVPGPARYDWSHSRMIVLRNAPLQAELDAARAAAMAPRRAGELVLYANGWVGQTRGAPIFLELVTRAAATGLPIRVVIAGRMDGPSAAALTSHPLVTFIGEVPQAKALALYAGCDAVLTYYDPVVPINRQAESNKWGDAVLLRCPIIVNSEVTSAEAFVAEGAAWAVPYHDVEALLALVQRLLSTPGEVSAKRSRLAAFDQMYPIFDAQLEQILSILYDEGEATC